MPSKPTLQPIRLTSPLPPTSYHSTSPSSATRRITSWGSAVSDSGSMLSVGPYGDRDMTPLPSPVGSWMEDPLDAAGSSRDLHTHHERQASASSESSAQSRSHAKTASFFSDLSGGSLSPPPNPPSRSNSLKDAAKPRRSWLDPPPSLSPPEASTSSLSNGRHDLHVKPPPPHSRHNMDSSEMSPTAFASAFPSAPQLPSLPPLRSLEFVSHDFAPSPPRTPLTSSQSLSRKPNLSSLRIDRLDSRPRAHSLSTIPGMSMSSLPTAIEAPYRPGSRFLNLDSPSSPYEDDLTFITSRALSERTPSFLVESTDPMDASASHVQDVSPEVEDIPPPAEGDTIGEYSVQRVLGKGAFSRVVLGKWKGKGKEGEEMEVGEMNGGTLQEGALVALKLISRSSYAGNERMRISVVREVEVLKRIHHPSLVSLICSFATPTYTVLVLDYAEGGELFDLIATSHSSMTEGLARRIFGELCLAVGWMHRIFLVHRDIKLENILLTTRLPLANIPPSAVLDHIPSPLVKLTDFGLSRFVAPESPLLATRCGSEAYAAPELIMGKKYDGRRTDAWALGVVLYALLTGLMPFIEEPNGRGRKGYLLRIAKGEFKWPTVAGATLNGSEASSPTLSTSPGGINGEAAARLCTPEAKALVNSLLTRDATRRATVQDVWLSPWMKGEGRPERSEGWVTPKESGEDGAVEETWRRPGEA